MDVENHCLCQGFGRGNLIYKSHGFTVIELLITLAVSSILVANAFPNFSALIAQERSIILTNTLASAFAYARTEAITKQINVVTCQSNDGIECNGSQDWHNGWIIFSDKNSNRQRESDETLLRVYRSANDGTEVKFFGSGPRPNYYMKHKPAGTAYPNGSFIICNPNIGVGKALIMYRTGRLR